VNHHNPNKKYKSKLRISLTPPKKTKIRPMVWKIVVTRRPEGGREGEGILFLYNTNTTTPHMRVGPSM
jgi:hypothetical protein